MKELIQALPAEITGCAFVKKFVHSDYSEDFLQPDTPPNTVKGKREGLITQQSLLHELLK